MIAERAWGIRFSLWLSSMALLALTGCDGFTSDSVDAGAGAGGISAETAGGGGTAAAGASAEGRCTPSEVRCSAEVLQVCREDGVWGARQICPTAALCAPEGCGQAQCRAGDLACDGPLLVACNAERTGWETLRDCGNANLCDATLMECGACTANTFSCSGAELRQCNDNAEWLPIAACETAGLCDASAGECTPSVCAPGETRCDGARFEQCNDALDGWTLVEACVSEALCGTGGCKTLVCEKGEVRCQGNQLQACSVDQSQYNVTDTCQGPAYCNASAARCTESPCAAGELQCNGRYLERCSDTRDEWLLVEECASATLCTASAAQTFVCESPLCALDEYSCEGSTLQRCAQGRNAWVTEEQCATAELCELSAATSLGTCRSPACNRDQYRCRDGGAVLEVCSEGRTAFEFSADCQDGQCDAARGVCAPCEPGGFSCNDGRLQRCDAGVGWVFQEQCATAALCDAEFSSCHPPECAPGQYRCDQSALYACDPDRRSWVLEEQCGGDQTCNPELGRCEDCPPGDAYCSGDTRYVCDSTGTGYVPEQCGSGRCEPEGCRICTPGNFTCTAALALQECDDSGRTLTQRADCSEVGSCQASQQRCCTPDSNLGCDVAGEAVLVCAANGFTLGTDRCDLGALDACEDGVCTGCDPNDNVSQCNGAGTAVQTCVDARFQNTTLCEIACISRSQQNAAFCAPDCAPGADTRCSSDAASVQSCDDNGSWGATEPCDFGCLESTQECAPQCRPGQRRCEPTGDRPQLCDETGRWTYNDQACDAVCSDGACVDCLVDDDCTAADAATCDTTLSCVPCTVASDCGHFANLMACADGLCVECDSDDDCNGALCDALNHTCVECLDDTDCSALKTPACGPGGVCGPCQENGDCEGLSVCDIRPDSGTVGQCLGCLSDTDCEARGEGKPYCGANGSCFECEEDANCTGNDVCTGSGTCVQCIADADCPSGAASSCVANACVPCTDNTDCAHISGSPVCTSGACVACSTDGDCDDGLVCNGTETCSGSTCVAGSVPTCADPNPCTSDVCSNTANGCVHVAVAAGTNCDTDSNVCNGTGTCSGTMCTVQAAPDCDSDDPCQVGSCDPVAGCQLTNATNGTGCDDGDPCNGADSCQAGACVSGTATCNDNNPCTTDTCGASGCSHAAVTNGTACDDGNSCTVGTTCQSGTCSGGELPCNDDNPCTTETCTPGTGVCTSQPQPDTCSADVVMQCGASDWEASTDCAESGATCFAGACCTPADATDCAPGDCDSVGNDDGCGGTYDCPPCD